jgi:predicted molibdopterin-dependent oxidoreductase YjgC
MSTSLIWIEVNGQRVGVPTGTSVAAAIAHQEQAFRRSVSGQPRAPLCGMGVCFECRVNIDGQTQQRACMLTVRDNMQVTTDA